MTNFKIGDIVELDKEAYGYKCVKDFKELKGKLTVLDFDGDFLYFRGDRSSGMGWLKERFKLVTPAKEVKPAKKPHAWVVVRKRCNSIESVWITRAMARNHIDEWKSAYKVKKVFLEFAE